MSCDNGQKIGYNDIANNLLKYDSYIKDIKEGKGR